MRRILPFVALALVSCSRDAQRAAEDSAPSGRSEPDPIALRIPRTGGTARAAIYPALDSVIWTATAVPAPNRVLGFDPDGGTIAMVTSAGLPARIDLRLARATIASRQRLRSLVSSAAGDIFGVDAKGVIVRLTAVGESRIETPLPARSVFPQHDGSLIVVASSARQTTLWRLFPPDSTLLDTAFLPLVGRSVRSQLADRLYFTTDTALVGVRGRLLEPVRSVPLRGQVTAIASTPSGDRMYVGLRGRRSLIVVDRYSERASGEVTLPSAAADLRMDPLGRYLLARSANADSVYVVAIGTDRVVSALPTEWLTDLPAVAHDGAIATIIERDVVFVDPESGTQLRRVAGGARDFWTFFYWNGFRPRAAGLDRPVTFAAPDTAQTDSVGGIDSAGGSSEPAPMPQAPPEPPAPTYVVSFAALLSAERAQAVADSITSRGQRARVVPSARAGATVHRVILGPYRTRDEAEEAGRASGRSYWIYEGEP